MRTLIAATAAVALTALAAPTRAALEWDLPLAWPANNYIVQNVQAWAERVREATGGEVNITLHPGGALGFKGPEMISAIRDGLVPIGDVLLSQQVGEDLIFGLESQPYLIAEFDDLRRFSTLFAPLLNEVLAQHNQKALFSIPWPQQQIFTKAPITSIADMKGLLIRSGDKQVTEILQAAGMTPVQLPWGEVIPALAAGTIHAVATSSPSAVDGSFWETLRYAYPLRHTWNRNIVSVNLDAWNRLTAAQRATLERLGKEMEPLLWENARENDAAMIAKLVENGMLVGQVSNTLRAELRQRTVALRDSTIARMGPKAQAVVTAFMRP